jgi:hypothetical protein
MTEKVMALPPNPLRSTRVANNIIPVVVDRDTNEGCCCPPLLLVVLLLVVEDDDDAPGVPPPVGVDVGTEQSVSRVAIGSTMAFK